MTMCGLSRSCSSKCCLARPHPVCGRRMPFVAGRKLVNRPKERKERKQKGGNQMERSQEHRQHEVLNTNRSSVADRKSANRPKEKKWVLKEKKEQHSQAQKKKKCSKQPFTAEKSSGKKQGKARFAALNI